MSVGTRLRQLRRDRGLSVEELSARTRISVRILRAIEQDDFESVPAGIFMRGYLRACAREVGVDPEPLVEEYRTEHEAPPPALDAPAIEPPPVAPAPATRLRLEPRVAHAPAGFVGRAREVGALQPPALATRPAATPEAAPGPGGARVALRLLAAARGWDRHVRPVALALAAAMVTLMVIWSASRPRPATVADHPAVPPPVSAVTAARQAVGTSGTTSQGADARDDRTAASSHAAATDSTMRLQLTAKRRVWVTAHADHKRVLYRLLEANEQVSVTGTEQIKVRVGDAGALLYSFNGSEPRPAGSPGEVRNVAFSRAQRGY